jgi:amidase
VDFANYVEWLRLTYAITLTSCPALALPCGFTADNRPIGLQLIAPPRAEAALLSAAAAAESAFNLTHLLPIDPQMPSPAQREREGTRAPARGG